jgi:hypothetical protein
MDEIEKRLSDWHSSLEQTKEVDRAAIIARNGIAHEWEALFKSWIYRIALFWRMYELLQQTVNLLKDGHGLGARILLRSALETFGALVFLNEKMKNVLAGRESFSDFSENMSKMLIGSRDNSTPRLSINILTMLEKTEKKYPEITKFYKLLCESAHPNYDGLLNGYSTIDTDKHIVSFHHFWNSEWDSSQLSFLVNCMKLFEHEYHKWINIYRELESWVENHNEEIRAEFAQE